MRRLILAAVLALGLTAASATPAAAHHTTQAQRNFLCHIFRPYGKGYIVVANEANPSLYICVAAWSVSPEVCMYFEVWQGDSGLFTGPHYSGGVNCPG